MKQNPFSLYDFLGYFIPGASTIYLIFIINFFKSNNSFDLDLFLNILPNANTAGVLLFLIISYVLGHLISYVSSITVETYANWRYGYPSKYLLNFTHAGYWKGAKSFHSIFWRILLLIFLLPMVTLDYILGLKFGFKNFYHKKLDPLLVKFIIDKTNQLLMYLGMDKDKYEEGEANDSDFFRIVMHYTYENSKTHQSKLSNYVALYGFLRTITLIFNILFIYITIHTLIFEKFNYKIVIILVFTFFLSYLFFMAFMKFYRRYTLEGFMILAIDKELKHKSPSINPH